MGSSPGGHNYDRVQGSSPRTKEGKWNSRGENMQNVSKKKKMMGSRDRVKIKGESVEEKGSKSLSRDPDSEHCVSSY